ncbi:hypothetical protein OF829_18895 [Sphingomonas sp. LB-2]|uniref:hypothetical protein n=1 Tax=Sphingomonas caeni TaxID=2984949 RepID=UPI00222EAC19|nr:hypothetical protein [Sphingomonas caeni]MCW3849311.1 hypothetical protein [Sphingomonas caeni]
MDQAKLARIAMMGRRQCYFHPDFITPGERSELLGWARSMRPHLPPGDPGRFFRKVAELPRQSPLYTPLRLRLQALFGLGEDAEPEPHLGWFLGMGDPGSRIVPHHDNTPRGTCILRCNLFLQLPSRGGLPVIENAPFEVKPGTLLAFLPSELLHWSQPVEGRKRRIVLSFGYRVPGDYRLPPTAHP